MYMTKLTSQGTITLPAELRRKYHLKPGHVLTIQDLDMLVIHKVPSVADVRERNKQYLTKRARVAPGAYRQGDGMTAHVTDTHGNK
jgi:bifunctional DNA-binding transcriptional regulator/antitoxin component of YhaV-PrlF toxin-antitoxin module